MNLKQSIAALANRCGYSIMRRTTFERLIESSQEMRTQLAAFETPEYLALLEKMKGMTSQEAQQFTSGGGIGLPPSPFSEENWPWLVPSERRIRPSGWTEIYELSNAVWDFYGVLCRAYYAARNKPKDPDLSFLREQWFADNSFDQSISAMKALFSEDFQQLYRIDDLPHGFVGLASEDRADLEEITNKETISYRLSAEGLAVVSHFLREVQPILECKTLSYWSVVNVRPRASIPCGTDGMHSWHKDGTPHPLLKILCYLLPQNPVDGTAEIVTIDGASVLLSSDRPSWLLFNPGVLLHRGIPGREQLRPIVEIMLMPALAPDMEAKYVGLGGHYPWFPPMPKVVPDAVDIPLELPTLQFSRVASQFAAIVDKYLVAARSSQNGARP